MTIPTGPVVGALLGVAATAAILLAVDGALPRHRTDNRRPLHVGRGTAIRAAAGTACGLLIAVLTGWPIAGLFTLAGIVVLPGLLAGGADAKTQIAKIEAIGTWTESLRDNLAAAAGVEQAIIAAAVAPPAAIADDIQALADTLRHRRRPLADGLADLQRRLADPIADLVIVQLLVASDAPTGRLAQTLSQIAAVARSHVTLRLDVEADRAPVRTELRLVVALTIALVGGLRILRPAFLAPYGTVTGQLILTVVGLLFAAGLAIMAALSRDTHAPRVMTGPTGIEPAQPSTAIRTGGAR